MGSVKKRKFRKKLGVTLVAATMVIVTILLIFCLVFLIAGESSDVVNFLLIIYIALALTIIAGILIFLKREFKKIDDEEEK
jgi:Kef-type K+ transport system membrane component KefB